MAHLGLDRVGLLLMLATASAGAPVGATGQMTPAERADLVLRLLPIEARSGATVVLRGTDREERYRTGTNGFLCVSDATTPQRLSMVCHHRVLEERLRFERRLRVETGLGGDAFRERLCAEVARRRWQVPNGAMEITASLTRDGAGRPAAEMTVYHLLWFPHSTTATLGVVDEDPGGGRPFLHHAGTCGAHVMWSEVVPVNEGIR